MSAVRYQVDEDLAGRIFRFGLGRSPKPTSQHVTAAVIPFAVVAFAFWHACGFRSTPGVLAGSVLLGLLFAVLGYFVSLSGSNISATEQAKAAFNPGRRIDVVVDLASDALTVSEDEVTTLIPWHAVSSIVNTDEWILIEYGSNTLLPIPVAAFADAGAAVEFVNLARKLSSEKREAHKRFSPSGHGRVPTDLG